MATKEDIKAALEISFDTIGDELLSVGVKTEEEAKELGYLISKIYLTAYKVNEQLGEASIKSSVILNADALGPKLVKYKGLRNLITKGFVTFRDLIV